MKEHLIGYLFIYLSWYLNQKTAKWPLQSLSQAVICYNQSNHSMIQYESLLA